MNQHVAIFNAGNGGKRKRNILIFWKPHSSRMGGKQLFHQLYWKRLARWKYGKVNSNSTLNLCFVLFLQDFQLKSSTNHSGGCISWTCREGKPWSRK